MDSFIPTCIFCKTPLEGNLPTVTVQKGIKKIIECSLDRKDSLHLELEGKNVITVYVKCRQNYTRPTRINTSEERFALEEPNNGITLINSVSQFDFETGCFFCGEKCSLDVKYPSHRRKSVHNVSSMAMRDNILRQCELRNDNWGNDVRSRICNVLDLVAIRARYHNACYKDFFYKTHENIIGPPKSKTEEAFLAMCDSIENSDECQFTLKELPYNRLCRNFFPKNAKMIQMHCILTDI